MLVLVTYPGTGGGVEPVIPAALPLSRDDLERVVVAALARAAARRAWVVRIYAAPWPVGPMCGLRWDDWVIPYHLAGSRLADFVETLCEAYHDGPTD